MGSWSVEFVPSARTDGAHCRGSMPNAEHTYGHDSGSHEQLLIKEFTLSHSLITITMSSHGYIIISKLFFHTLFFFKSTHPFYLNIFKRNFIPTINGKPVSLAIKIIIKLNT